MSLREKKFKPNRKPVSLEVTARVMIEGKPCRPGDIVELPFCDAIDVVGLNRGKILQTPGLQDLESIVIDHGH